MDFLPCRPYQITDAVRRREGSWGGEQDAAQFGLVAAVAGSRKLHQQVFQLRPRKHGFAGSQDAGVAGVVLRPDGAQTVRFAPRSL